MKNNFKAELKTVLKVAKWQFLCNTINAIFIRALLLIIPVLFSEAINFVTKQNFKMAIIFIIISIVVTGIYRFSEGMYQITYYNLYKKLFSYYSDIGIEKTNDNSLFSLSRFNLGQYTNMVITDVDIISGFFTAGVLRVIQVIEFLVIYIYFFFIDIFFFIIALIVSIIMLLIAIKSGKKVQKLNEDRKLELDNMTSSVHEYFKGIKEVKSFNLFSKIYVNVSRNIYKYLNAHANYNIKFNCNNYGCLFVFEFSRLISMIYGIYLASIGQMEVGALLIIYNYYQKIIDNFNIILIINVEYRNLKVSMARFYKLIEYSHPKNNLNDLNNICNGKIEFKDILYGFRSNPMLNNVSFTISPNSITAFVGKDEAAQNGIFDLLLKLNKQHEGKILIDDIDINDINDESYFSIISSARRDSYFFNVSIKDNFMMIDNNFENIVKICKKIGVDEEINKLTNGYDTILDSNTPINQSTKELFVIARMLLKNSKILLFDDSINNLDDKIEEKFIELLLELKYDHTIIIVCNQKNILDKVDKIYEVNNKNVKKLN